MMKKTMKKMAALTMAGMMAMSISTGTVSVLAAETDEVEGWEVVGTTSSCIPVSEYEGELDEYAPEDGYVLDVQFVNSDVKDYYVFPMFICDLTGDAYPGEHVAAVLLNTEAVYSPDAVVAILRLCCVRMLSGWKPALRKMSVIILILMQRITLLSAIQNMQSMIRPQGTMPVDLNQSRATIWEPLLCRSRYMMQTLLTHR